MTDRGLTRSHCDQCFKRLYLDQLTRFQVLEPDGNWEYFNQRLCRSCLEIAESWYRVADMLLIFIYRSP